MVDNSLKALRYFDEVSCRLKLVVHTNYVCVYKHKLVCACVQSRFIYICRDTYSTVTVSGYVVFLLFTHVVEH